jgi:hypothetical protein
VRTVLVSLPSGAGVVRLEDGHLLVTDEVDAGGGSCLREEDRFGPAKSWVDENRCVVGGLLPPGAVSAEVVDDRGERVAASVGDGAYVAVLEQPNDGREAIVCCRDAAGDPVRRPWAGEYPSVRVTDTEEACPACGAIDWDEYTPFEEWRGGSAGPNGSTIRPNPVVSCRVCGHEEPEGFFYALSDSDESEDEATRAARLARARAEQRKHSWLSGVLTLRATEFPIYAAESWPARLGGSGSRGDELTQITVEHYGSPDADPFAGDRPRLMVITKRGESGSGQVLQDARDALESWVDRMLSGSEWPDASHAAITLWLRARERERRAAVLNAERSERVLTIDGAATSALVLSGPGDRWVAVVRRADLTIIVAGCGVELGSLQLEPIADPPARLLGPEPPDAD